ncbi:MULTISPECIES: amidohydrolase family protein [Alphaproteobacteria]|uniref:Amidohydrolase n=1 Tax=Marinibacterium profundimaris TaxID=1679460 RepID=A0A225NEI8_9RHOB|nr:MULTISPECIES: amidohydrolase family protein [Alphaproteobacteria]MAC89145.1 amidohydrolase [Maricaulis sp.]OWU71036.1 amidohydrolase [Marinibacterium profundimaris]
MSFIITNIAHGWTGEAAGTRVTSAIRVEGDRIAEVGDLTPAPGEEVIDATGCVVIPGLVNTHHHLFQSVLKGLAIDEALDNWLAQVPYRFWPRLDEEALRVSARIGLAELALTGATTVCDHHYLFPDAYDYDPAEVLFDEAGKLGLRFVLARGGMTKGRQFGADTPPPPTETLAQFLDGLSAAASRWHDPSDMAMTRVACAPTTPNFNVEPGELVEMAQEARRLGLRLHCHLSENGGYAAHTLKTWGQRPVPWLADKGWLGEDVWFAHLVDLEADEVALLAETGSAMAHCPQANARLGSGVAPAPALHGLGGAVSLAVDGAGANEAADMGMALYSAFAIQRATGGVDAVNAGTVLHWATMGGAKALGIPGIGRIAPGMAADITLFDLSHPRTFGLHDPALAPVVSGAAQVRHSFVAGRPVVRDGRLPGLDLADLARDAARITARVAARPETMPA